MADNIIQSLFGLDPYQTQTQQQDALRQQAAAYANMAPQQRAAMSLYQAGGQLAGAGAEGLFGMVNPAVAKAQATEQAMMGLDMSSPQSILARANSVTDPRLRIQLQLLAQQAVEKQQAAALTTARTLAELKKATTEASPIAKLNPKDYTPESWAAYIKSGSTADLRALDTKGTWSEPYQLGGATVQKNSATGEIRTAVTRPPVTHLSVETGAADFTPEQLEFYARQQLMGDTSWRVGLGRLKEGGKMILEVDRMVPKIAKDVGMTPEEVMTNKQEFVTRAAALKSFKTGKQGDIVRSMSVAMDHLDTLAQLGTALANNDVRAINAAGNAVSKWTGGDAVTNFDTAKQIVADEVMKAIIGGATALGDREVAAANIAAMSSPKQLAGYVKTVQKLLGGQLGGLRRQYEYSTKRKDFDEMLSPVARSLETTPAASTAPKTIVDFGSLK